MIKCPLTHVIVKALHRWGEPLMLRPPGSLCCFPNSEPNKPRGAALLTSTFRAATSDLSRLESLLANSTTHRLDWKHKKKNTPFGPFLTWLKWADGLYLPLQNRLRTPRFDGADGRLLLVDAVAVAAAWLWSTPTGAFHWGHCERRDPEACCCAPVPAGLCSSCALQRCSRSNVEAPWLGTTARYSPKDAATICRLSFRNNFNPRGVSPVGPKHHSSEHKGAEKALIIARVICIITMFFRCARSIKIVNCSGPAVSSQQKSYVNRKSLFSSGHATRLVQEVPISEPHSSFKGV